MIALTPAANEPEFSDPAETGEFAAELPKMLVGPQTPPWCTYAARRDGCIVGMGGYKAPPDANGIAEIGYLTLRSCEGQGVAREIARQLVEIGHAQGLSMVTAHTLPEHNPSTRVLMANGFALRGAVEDPEDGTVWRWERPL